MDGVTFQALTKDLLPEAIDLAAVAFGEDYEEDARAALPEAFLENKYAPVILAAIFNDSVVGIVRVGLTQLVEDHYRIDWLCVHPDYQKQGLGTQLLAEAEDAIAQRLDIPQGSISLWANTDSGYYKQHGYSELCTIDGHPIMHKSIRRVDT